MMLGWARRHAGIVREAVKYRRGLMDVYAARRVEDASVDAEAEAFGASPVDIRKARSRDDGIIQIATMFGPIHLRPKDTDLLVLRQVFVNGEYDIDKLGQMDFLKERYRQILADGDVPVIIDAGANIGAASMWFAGRFPEATILAVEPDPGNAAVARLNTASNAKAKVWEAALGSSDGTVELQTFADQGWGARTARSENGVTLVTIPNLLASVPRGKPLIVKIDIEGFESDVFESNVDWIDDAAAIILEPHDWMLPGAQTSQSFQKALMGTGRELLIVGENLMFVQ